MKTLPLSTLLMLIFLVFACSSKQETSEQATISSSSTSIEVINGWVRPAQAGMMTAAYFTIRNNTGAADSLLSVTYEFADDTQIHESFEAEGGMMGMRPVGLVPVAPESMVELNPGGIHVMVIRPFENISEGDSLELTLTFSEIGDHIIKLPVKSTQ